MANKAAVARWSISKHRWLAIIAAISLFVWGLSGLTHIAMVLFGPQQVQFMPPQRPLDLSGAAPIADTLARAGIGEAVAIRTVPGEQTSLLQVTSDPMQPRRYFDPATGAELVSHDRAQAIFLARHFLGEERPIASATLQRDFDADYPWVNRLLPVWRVRFAGDDQLTAYVHTETTSVAAVNNVTKTRLQTLFRALHTWEWVPPSMDWLRVLVIGLMVGSLAAMGVTGITMLISIRRKKRLPGAKGWHRMAGYVLALPLLMFSLSGLYHLVQGAIEEPTSHLRMAAPIALGNDRFPITEQWREVTAGLDVVSLSLVEGANGQALYRLGLAGPGGAMARGEHDHGAHHGSRHMPTTETEIRNARFDGVQPNGPALYLDAQTGAAAPQGDRDLARALGNRFLGAGDDAVTGMTLVTRFGPDYDFRNKRLPVWRIDYAAPHHTTIFVDTATGTLVDRLDDWQKPERYVFSFIHKWNFLFPLGRVGLNAVVGAFAIALMVLLGVLGMIVYARGRRAKRDRAGGLPRVRIHRVRG